MSDKYQKVEEGDWFPIARRGNRLVCCACGFTHTLDNRINENGEVELRFFVHRRATAAVRRGKEYKGLKLPRVRKSK